MKNIGQFAGRKTFRDGLLTFDSNPMQTLDGVGNMRGRNLGGRYQTHDGKTVDSTGAFLVGELERLDMTLHEPLASVTWGRDIDLREDVTIADEVSSFTTSTYGSPGSLGGGSGIRTGKAWAGKKADQITSLSLDIAKTPNPLRPWAMELAYTILELESAAKVGRPVDQQKFEGLKLKHQMDIDEQVYVGDATTGDTGLLNQANTVVTNVANVANGIGGSPLWANKTPDEILADVNELLESVWAASAYAFPPSRLLLSPLPFGYIVTQKVSSAGNVSIRTYLEDNNLFTKGTGKKLEIFPVKWAMGSGVGGTIGTQNGHDRMVAYSKEKERVRYPMTLLQKTPIQYDSIFHKTTYFCRLGVLEVVYAQTIGYRDGVA